MRKIALVTLAALGLLAVAASPAHADSPPTATVEWQEELSSTGRIEGTLGPHTVSIVPVPNREPPTNTVTVDWVNGEATNDVTAGGVTSNSAGVVAQPPGSTNLRLVSVGPAITDAILLFSHGAPGTSLQLPSGPDFTVLDSNNVSVSGNLYTFTQAATGSADDGLAVLYSGSRTALSFAFQNLTSSHHTIALTVATSAPVAEDIVATTVVDTPVTVTPTATPPAGRTIDPASTRLVDGSTPVTSLTNDDGTYVANPDGTITFTPAPGFTGATLPVAYRVTDSAGITGTALLTVDVVPAAAVPILNPFLLAGAVAVVVPAGLVARRRRRTII